MRRWIAAGLLGLALAALPCPLRAGEDGKGAPAAPLPDLPSPRFVAPRFPGKERDEVVKRWLGSPETEKAVEAGLDWLERHALPDGGWDADGFPARCDARGQKCDGIGKNHHGEDEACPFDDALSAYAALAFLGHGHLPDPKGDARARLLEKTMRRLEGTEDVWALALSTEAFSEAEALERKGLWRAAAAKGAKALLAARQEDGGWGYCAPMRKGSDTPYTAFVVPALLAAKDAGVDLPEDLGSGVDRFLGTLEERKGKLAYLVDGRAYGYTPTAYNAHAAAAIREILKVGTSGARHAAHLAFVRENPPKWEISFREEDIPGRGKVQMQVGSLSEMNWWYGTIALGQRGGFEWSAWFSAAKKALLGHQRREGCARGSWNPEGQYERAVGGRILSTALGVLILEEPYRHRRP